MTIYFYNSTGQRAIPDRKKYGEIFGEQTKNDTLKVKELMCSLGYPFYGYHANGAHYAQLKRGEIIYV